LQLSGTGRRIALKSAVVLSQPCGNGVYGNFPVNTFPAVPAPKNQQFITTCCASLNAGLSTLSRTKPRSSPHDLPRGRVARPRFHRIAGSRGAPANVTLPISSASKSTKNQLFQESHRVPKRSRNLPSGFT